PAAPAKPPSRPPPNPSSAPPAAPSPAKSSAASSAACGGGEPHLSVREGERGGQIGALATIRRGRRGRQWVGAWLAEACAAPAWSLLRIDLSSPSAFADG